MTKLLGNPENAAFRRLVQLEKNRLRAIPLTLVCKYRQFQDSIAANTTRAVADAVAGRFSGTDSDAAVAFDIALMDAMKSYFDYWGEIACGIPEIIVEGTPEDWRQVEQRAAALAQYDLGWWMKDLAPILAEFTAAAEGKANRDFWVDIVRDMHDFGCGAQSETFLTGWIVRFFPYIKKEGVWKKNPLIGLKTADLYTVLPENKTIKQTSGFESLPTGHYELCTDQKQLQVHYTGTKVTLADIPPGICEVILNINNNGSLHKMELKAGFFGIRQDADTRTLRPTIGWAIIDTGEQPDEAVVKRYRTQKPN